MGDQEALSRQRVSDFGGVRVKQGEFGHTPKEKGALAGPLSSPASNREARNYQL